MSNLMKKTKEDVKDLFGETDVFEKRRPLARGNRYFYKGYKDVGFEVKWVTFRGHPNDNGGLPGVAIKWLGFTGRKGSGFWPSNNEKEFFAMLIFKNACNEEDA